MQSTRSALIDEQKLCIVDERLQRKIELLTARNDKITEWSTQTELFNRFVAVISKLKRLPTLTGNVGKDGIQEILKELYSIENLLNQKREGIKDIVNDCLKRELIPIKI